MSKPLQNSGRCIIDSHVSKMQERDWILLPQQDAQTLGTISQLDFIPIDTDRAKSFNVKFFDGNFEDGLVFSTFSNFYPVTDLQFAGIKIPDYPFGNKPQFMLESLPSKDKQAFYNEVNVWKTKAAHQNSFDVLVDVITEDGTVLQTWNYFNCEITGYEMVLDENLLLVKYHDQWQSEIVDKSKFSCRGLDFQAGI